MLVSEFRAIHAAPVFNLIAKGKPTVEIRTGIYETYHFGGGVYMPGYDHNPELPVPASGVCDSLEQLLEFCPELEASKRKFVITLTPINLGEWKWQNFGEYIGRQIRSGIVINIAVYAYHIYERTVKCQLSHQWSSEYF